MICGVDEAGKGPVIGPMVVAAVLIDNAKQIEGAGFKDSKLLTIQKRRELFDLIRQNYRYVVEIIKPEEIDKYRRKNQLNILNRKAFEKLLDCLSKKEHKKAEIAALLTARYLWNFLSGMVDKHSLKLAA